MPNDRFYVERDDELVADAHDFLHALSWASEQMVRRSDADRLAILVGDEDGPHEYIAKLETIDVADNAEAFAKDAELVLMFESTKVVPRLYQPFIGDIMIVPGNFKGDVPLDEYQVYVDVSHESDLTVNPRKGRGAFTAKGERMYKHIVATQQLSAKRKQVDAKRVAAATVKSAAARGVPGLVRKNPPTAYTPKGLRLFEQTKRRLIAEGMDPLEAGARASRGILKLVDEGERDLVTPSGLRDLRRFFPGTTNPVTYRGHEPAEIFEEDASAAIDKYKEFHRYDPKKVEEIRGLAIPRRVKKLGPAAYVLYRSGKVDPATLQKPKKPVDYIHEHDAGVNAYSTEGAPDTDVPKSIYEATALVRLGYCLGFKMKDGQEAQGTAPLPDLCCTPDGKCLLVVQGKRKVLAMMWGGALGVFARGIDG